MKVALEEKLTRGGLRQRHVDLEYEVLWRGHLLSAGLGPISSIPVVQKLGGSGNLDQPYCH